MCSWATPAEHHRFLTARKGNVSDAYAMLRSHYDWRKNHGLLKLKRCETGMTEYSSTNSFISEEEDDWFSVSSTEVAEDEFAWKSSVSATLALPSHFCAASGLARLARFDDQYGSALHDKEGNRILQLLPAQMDCTATSYETYATCISLYLDQKLDRDSVEKIVVIIDVRGGEGWPNPPASTLVPFIKFITKILERNFPERMCRAIVYPLPWAATSLWNIVKVFIDRDTASKVKLVSGPAYTESPPPNDKLSLLIDADTLHRLEENRIRSFRHRK